METNFNFPAFPPSLQSHLWNLLKSIRHVTNSNKGHFLEVERGPWERGWTQRAMFRNPSPLSTRQKLSQSMKSRLRVVPLSLCPSCVTRKKTAKKMAAFFHGFLSRHARRTKRVTHDGLSQRGTTRSLLKS